MQLECYLGVCLQDPLCVVDSVQKPTGYPSGFGSASLMAPLGLTICPRIKLESTLQITSKLRKGISNAPEGCCFASDVVGVYVKIEMEQLRRWYALD